MSREIKFRAWDKEQECLLSWGELMDVRYNERWFVDNTDKNYINCIFNDSDYVLEQYTGIRDINGEEVYEGDIIIFNNSEIGGGITKGEVIWNTDLTLCGLGWHLWVFETNIPKHHSGFMGMDWLGIVEVVGNIHKNPELLEE